MKKTIEFMGKTFTGSVNELINIICNSGYTSAYEEQNGITAIYYYPKDWDWDEWPPEEDHFKFV